MRSAMEVADQKHARFVSARGELVEAVADLAETEAWRGDGATTLPSWLAARWQVSLSFARDLVADAEALAARPALAAALKRAEVSVDQCKALQVLSPEGTDDDQVWLETLPFWTLSELQREARKTKARELERRDGGVYLRMRHTSDERYLRGEFQVHPEQGATLMAAIDARIPVGTRLRDWDHAAAVALVEMAKHTLGSQPSPDRATVLMSVDEATLTQNPDADTVAELGSGGLIGTDTALRLACDARLQPLLKNTNGLITGIGHTSRTIPPWLRRAVEDRDGGMCTFPGCGLTHYLECHHIIPWAQGGPTDLPNLLTTCWVHHEKLHEGGWRVEGEPGPHITWIRPDGTPYEPRVRVTLDTC